MADGTGKMLRASNLERIPLSAETPRSSLREGARVRVTGLQAKPELNGLEGTILGPGEGWDANEERWRVCMADGTGTMYKSSNLQLVETSEEASAREPVAAVGYPNAAASVDQAFSTGDSVRITGLQARPELNGLEGTLVKWDAAEERWRIR